MIRNTVGSYLQGLVIGGMIGGLLLGGLGCSGAEQGTAGGGSPQFSVLVFSKTTADGYRHASIPDGIQAFKELGREHSFAVAATEDASVFTSDSLAQYDAVVFLSTSGDVLDAAQQQAFEEYIRGGGNFMGVHGASATEYDWSWYGRLVGAFFDDHPEIQTATIDVVNEEAPSTQHLPARWSWTDEWYNFRSDPSDSVDVLLEVDEQTYEGGSMGTDHPIAWKHRFEGARSFYTALGHRKEAYETPRFLRHLHKGLDWTVGDLGPFVEANFSSVPAAVSSRTEGRNR